LPPAVLTKEVSVALLFFGHLLHALIDLTQRRINQPIAAIAEAENPVLAPLNRSV